MEVVDRVGGGPRSNGLSRAPASNLLDWHGGSPAGGDSKEVEILRRLQNPPASVVAFSPGNRSAFGPRDGVWRLSGRRWLSFRALAALVEPRGDVTHAFGHVDGWHQFRSLGRRPFVFTVVIPGSRSSLDGPLRPSLRRRERTACCVATRRGDCERPYSDHLSRSRSYEFRPAPMPSGTPFRILFASSPAYPSEFDARGLPLLIELARRHRDIEVVVLWREWGAVDESRRRLEALGPPDNFKVERRGGRRMAEVYAGVTRRLVSFVRASASRAPIRLSKAWRAAVPRSSPRRAGSQSLWRGTGQGYRYHGPWTPSVAGWRICVPNSRAADIRRGVSRRVASGSSASFAATPTPISRSPLSPRGPRNADKSRPAAGLVRCRATLARAIRGCWFARLLRNAPEKLQESPPEARAPADGAWSGSPSRGPDRASAVDYDIVYVRQPRCGDVETPWPEVSHPARLDPGADLMLLHPDGTEEVLVAGGNGAVTDPFVSFDAQWVYYATSPTSGRTTSTRSARPAATPAPTSTASISRRATSSGSRFGSSRRTPAPGNWDEESNPVDPGDANDTLGYGILNLGSGAARGRQVASPATATASPPKGCHQPDAPALRDGRGRRNVTPIAPMTLGSALHPTPLQDGRLMFSSSRARACATTALGHLGDLAGRPRLGAGRQRVPASAGVPLHDAAEQRRPRRRGLLQPEQQRLRRALPLAAAGRRPANRAS